MQWPCGVAVNMPPCHGGDRRFDSGRGRQIQFLKSSVASRKLSAIISIHPARITLYLYAAGLAHHIAQICSSQPRVVDGSFGIPSCCYLGWL